MSYSNRNIGEASGCRTKSLTDLDIQTTDIVARRLRESREKERRRHLAPLMNDLDVHMYVIEQQTRQSSGQIPARCVVLPTAPNIPEDFLLQQTAAPVKSSSPKHVSNPCSEDQPPSYEECVKGKC